MDTIKNIKQENLVFIDESGINLSDCKDKGWGKKGQPLYGKKSGQYYKRLNFISGLTGEKPIAPLIFEGSCDTEFFNAWVEQFLVRELKPGQTVGLDKASFHKSPKTKTLIESVGCNILFLPPYSPDLNPIEKFWANLKRWLHSNVHHFNSSFLAISFFFIAS